MEDKELKSAEEQEAMPTQRENTPQVPRKAPIRKYGKQTRTDSRTQGTRSTGEDLTDPIRDFPEDNEFDGDNDGDNDDDMDVDVDNGGHRDITAHLGSINLDAAGSSTRLSRRELTLHLEIIVIFTNIVHSFGRTTLPSASPPRRRTLYVSPIPETPR